MEEIPKGYFQALVDLRLKMLDAIDFTGIDKNDPVFTLNEIEGYIKELMEDDKCLE